MSLCCSFSKLVITDGVSFAALSLRASSSFSPLVLPSIASSLSTQASFHTFAKKKHAPVSSFPKAMTTSKYSMKTSGIASTRWLQSNVCVTRKQIKSQAIQGRQMKFTAVLEDKSIDVECQYVVKPPLVKICGVMNVKDGLLAAQAGASFVGMILWPNSKRSVSVGTAKEIAQAARMHKAEPVGVFVDEDADTIERWCKEADIHIVQLHGEGARESLMNLPSHLATIYVVHADKSGTVQTQLPEADSVDWILVDSLQGGSGHTFDWEKLKALDIKSKQGWLLAGGLKPENVATAISVLKPDFVDVSSGVTMPDGLLKDPVRVLAFMDAVKASMMPC